MRADQLLLHRSIASSRSQAQRLIASGVRWRADLGSEADALAATWKRIGKNSDELPADALIELLDASEAKYVSRGGLKLEGALQSSGIVVAGKTCLDVGQSTGGFTDCLLQHGAECVVGIDVGSGQLHPNLRVDPRVVALENVNARNLNATELVAAYAHIPRPEGQFSPQDEPEALYPTEFDLIVGDLSFISQTLVLPALVPLLKPSAEVLMLVKPQFELQPGQVGKGGIVRDPAMYAIVEARIRESYTALGLQVLGWFDSPITGGDGNHEFFVYARHVVKGTS